MAAFDLTYLQNSFRRKFFWFTPFSQHSKLGSLWLPTPDYAAAVWLMGRHPTPLLIRCFPPHLFTSSLTLLWAMARFLDPFYTQPSSLQSDLLQFPTQPLARKAENFPRGDNHSKHVPLLIYLAWLHPIYYDLGFVFIHVKLWTLWWKFDKKSIEQQPH